MTRIETRRKALRIPFPAALQSVAGKKIAGISRRAKYILIEFLGGTTMILHLGMSGRMVIHPKGSKVREKHDHMIMTLGSGAEIVFNDARRFGLVDLSPTKEVDKHRFFRHLGPEPLERHFDADYLAQKISDKKISIKLAIMDQRIVVGVGNIYASEALFMSGIDPKRKAGSMTPAETKKLVTAIKAVLKKAIAAGGSSLRDYVQADGELGYFQHSWAVYGRAGEKCRKCKTPLSKITQGGRSTFYCPSCQK